MFFESVTDGGCKSYVIACEETCQAAIIDPSLAKLDHYTGIMNREGLNVRYLIDTHTHADHFSAAKHLGQHFQAPVVMHRYSPAPHVDLHVEDGHSLVLGDLRLKVLYTPGHTRDSICLHAHDRVFTGDTLLIGGTGRSDLPTGDPEQLYESLFGKLLDLPGGTLVFPGHDYRGNESSTIAAEKAENRRLKPRTLGEFVELMASLNLAAPTHLTEALRTNMTGGKTVRQLLSDAARNIPFMSLSDLKARLDEKRNDFVVLDVRERDAYQRGHVPGALHLARGQLEMKVDQTFPDPHLEIVTICEVGRISTLAAATLREIGFMRAVALDGGMERWKEEGFPIDTGEDPALLI
ncbi:MBL fold metallo-hydrolase [Altererythrobacter sp. MF3-039]|uniref:MBL fold metallo-hydrolase n=1 Tax=Altererythrobacter sp. MF3-039 TaxID=3252901 RepID=UPI00390CD9CD